MIAMTPEAITTQNVDRRSLKSIIFLHQSFFHILRSQNKEADNQANLPCHLERQDNFNWSEGLHMILLRRRHNPTLREDGVYGL